MALRFVPPCRNCGGEGWYREPDPAGRGPLERCENCNPMPKPKTARMTKDALKAHLATLGWSSGHLGRLLGCHVKTPQNWLLGRNAIPAAVAAWLVRRVAEHERMLAVDPPPQK